MTDEERRVINMPLHDIEIHITGNTSVQKFIASIIRRQRYCLAMLIQSRGRTPVASVSKCATTSTPRFCQCTRIPTF
ncbi:uncharacterized protein CTRU02_207233 [Colletotrichum truncatum]|uniref:Uncharacterized protein n=1 Tax=Colletotrichum truncatum TaxID=5467 RepID=A0ACC3Z089_COLTU|nr:uncharacterized protein CTRU02_01135 [Colletotrichum truncatum]KAF6800730.1 hypothetical protein CTRU02_01135 [Colletotrichum truncatum]